MPSLITWSTECLARPKSQRLQGTRKKKETGAGAILGT